MMALDTPKPEFSLEDAVKSALSGSGIGDTSNNFIAIKFSLDIPQRWAEIDPPKTYEEYIRYKYERRPDIAEAVLEKSDKTFVAAYDAAIQKIKDTIGTGIQNERQAEEVGLRCAEAQKVVTDFCKQLRGEN